MIIQIEPWIDKRELREIKKVIESTFLIENKATKEFEEIVKKYTNSRYVLAVSNATVGLFCCLKSLGIGDDPSDEVIVPNVTFIATANSVLMAGSKVVLCDVDKSNGKMNIEELKRKITSKTKAIIPVHLYGYPCDMFSIKEICEEYGLYCIEDAAQGLGTFYYSKHVGTIGDCGVISLYGNKSITTGEGGLILTDNEEIYKKCYRLKNHGRDTKGVFIHDYIGYNFCYTDLQAAVGIAQMGKYDKILTKKRKIYDRYCEGFKNISNIRKIDYIDKQEKPNWWFSSFMFERSNELEKYLKENEVQTRKFFYPLHMQPCYVNFDRVIKSGEYIGSIEFFNNGLSLPSSYSLEPDQQKEVIEKIKRFYIL